MHFLPKWYIVVGKGCETVNGQLLEKLQRITEEEQKILDGSDGVDWSLYVQQRGSVINAQKLLSDGKLITVRPHTRFVHFPEHTHDFVEVVYMCSGETTHIVNGRRIILKEGDLLFLSQSAVHEVCRAEKQDVAVNFIVLPDFFVSVLPMIGDEETPLRKFLIDCLCGKNAGPGYLHFAVSNVPPIGNLVENLLWTLLRDVPNKRKVNQMTMALLFLQLMAHTDALQNDAPEDAAVIAALQYVESHYATGNFESLVEKLHYSPSWISREIKRKTGKTFTCLVQEKRLAQAAFLLKNTDANVAEIALAVGYENISYFHRLFSAHYGCSPRSYRLQEKTHF